MNDKFRTINGIGSCPSYIKEALENEVGLWTAFIWDETPQGVNFWRAYAEAEGGTAEGRAVLETWLAEATK